LSNRQTKQERTFVSKALTEVEVLRYLSDGKKNHEIADILKLNEKQLVRINYDY
jgi:DNA-binding NarL/FixJ family response regulator